MRSVKILIRLALSSLCLILCFLAVDAQTPLKITIKSIKCHVATDGDKVDEVTVFKIEDLGNTEVITSAGMRSGSVLSLNKSYTVKDRFFLFMYDRDRNNPDDYLGQIEIKTTDSKYQEELIEETLVFRGGKGYYTILINVEPQPESTVQINFHMVMASDSQYPRTLKSAYNDKKEARRLIRNHVSSMNELIDQFPVKGVVMNGDLTEYGHSWELARVKKEYGKLKAPFYPGLGNHDYENNVDDCLANNCAERMIRYIREFVKDKDLVDRSNFDFDSEEDEGSLAYFWDIGDVRFFQLHNYPTYETVVNEFDITASTSWLERECKKAREQNKHIIFNMHIENFGKPDKTASDASASTNKDKDKIIDIINNYEVSAVFVGHTHHQIGNIGWMGSASVLNCGASFTEQYMLVEFVGDKMKYWNVSSVDGKAKLFSQGEINLK